METVRVLSIDGGGIRRIIPAMVLAAIERRAGNQPRNGDKQHYFRLQARLNEGNDDMDDASRTNLRVLKLIAEDLIRDKDREIDDVVALLG